MGHDDGSTTFESAHARLAEISTALGWELPPPDEVVLTGPRHTLASPFDVTAAATAAIAAATRAVAVVASIGQDRVPTVRVDSMAATVACRSESVLQTESALPLWDPLFGAHRCRDGWIRIHTIYRHHRRAALDALDVPEDRSRYVSAIEERDGDELETAVVAAGGAAARLRSATDWEVHPHGSVVRRRPLVAIERIGDGPMPSRVAGSGGGPLDGLRVVDLTRVIAGPVATRFLAAHGADVLRIDAPDFVEHEPLLVDGGFGKRSTGLDLHEPDDRAVFEGLVGSADAIVHGYRPGALADLGYDDATLAGLRPGLVIASLSAWGGVGPWSDRRGFDSLVQMSSGIADGAGRPRPLPLQLLDHGTGYLIAAGLLTAFARRYREAGAWSVQASLARTAAWLLDAGATGDEAVEPLDAASVASHTMETVTNWGRTTHARPAGRVDGLPRPAWRRPPSRQRADAPTWAPRG